MVTNIKSVIVNSHSEDDWKELPIDCPVLQIFYLNEMKRRLVGREMHHYQKVSVKINPFQFDPFNMQQSVYRYFLSFERGFE